VRRSGQAVDFSVPSAFETIAAQCTETLAKCDPDLDLIVLDEVQAMLSRLRPDGKPRRHRHRQHAGP